MKLFIYPVYISNTPINVDEMVNFDIDKVKLPFLVNDIEAAHKIHSQVTVLLYSLVCYLRDKSIEVDSDLKSTRVMANQVNAEEEIEQEWVEDNLPEFLLYTALKTFCDFIKSYQREKGENLLAVYRKSIMDVGETEDSEQHVQTIKSDTEQGQRYLLSLHELIMDSLKKKEGWLWEGNESRGEKERCYYLDLKVWHDRFCEKLEKEKIEPIGKQKMAMYLKENQLLKRQKSSTANSMYRYGKNCHVILADVFDAKVNQWNSPLE